jgi:hypothetical protein
MNASEIELFYSPETRLRMTVGVTCSYISVKPVWASPLSHPDRFLGLMNGKGEEITTISDLSLLPKASERAVRDELRRRYLTPLISSIEDARCEFGVTYWTVNTDRGTRDFVTQSLQENAQWVSDDHLLLFDVDGNRFEIADVRALDERSRELIAHIV